MTSSLYPSQELRRRAMTWAVELHVNPRVVRVQEMKRKWGSCSSSGTVTLAFDLCDQDPRFQDYVIVHELLHLRGHVHGRVFSALMSAYLPDWRRIRTRCGEARIDCRDGQTPATHSARDAKHFVGRQSKQQRNRFRPTALRQ